MQARAPIRSSLPVALALGCAAACASTGPTEEALRGDRFRVVLLPLANHAGTVNAARAADAALRRLLETRGYTLVPPFEVEAALERHRLRYLDSLAPAARERLASDLGARAFVFASLLSFAEGANPHAALAARMIARDGRLLWSSAAGLGVADTEGAFGTGGVGSVRELLDRVASALGRTLPAPGQSQGPRAPEAAPARLSAPTTFRAIALDEGARVRVGLLPLQSRATMPAASRVVGELLAFHLAATGRFDVVEAAEMRAALQAEQIRSIRALDAATLSRLGGRLGTALFLGGTVYVLDEATSSHSSATPHAELTLQLIDVVRARVVWMSHHARSGTDYATLLGAGTVRESIALADRALREMIAAFLEAPATGPLRRIERGRP